MCRTCPLPLSLLCHLAVKSSRPGPLPHPLSLPSDRLLSRTAPPTGSQTPWPCTQALFTHGRDRASFARSRLTTWHGMAWHSIASNSPRPPATAAAVAAANDGSIFLSCSAWSVCPVGWLGSWLTTSGDGRQRRLARLAGWLAGWLRATRLPIFFTDEAAAVNT
ncbi:uncharacterized protein J3D65DRAFT_289797 [Phyllosticta citribraziliensis]|uniref:Secreted protein n=1 Tax=Phyllosticta citribraziliensis TaxID=989973 RepID=A0ABR1LWY2_9PEZI